MNEHTAGPWDAKRDPMPEGVEQYSVYEDATGIHVATVFGNEANANLVKAAPDMLAALENARNVLAALVVGDLRAIHRNSPALAQIRRAINKAKGAT